MTGLEICCDVSDDLLRVITLQRGQVAECAFDHAPLPSRCGAIYCGVVERVLSGGRSAFIKIAEHENGFLNDAQGLAEGQRILVQIKADGREEKGPLLSTHISLPGRYYIYQPLGHGVHASRRMERAADMGAADAHAGDIVQDRAGGWIIRSAAQNASSAQFREEADALFLAGQRLNTSVPGLLLSAPSVLEQSILAAPHPVSISIEQGLEWQKLTPYLQGVLPQELKRLSVQQMKNAFETHDLNGFCTSLQQSRVPLPSGGDVLFEHTQTMHVVDVNGGVNTHVLDVNRRAAEIIMQHIRWRNLGGLIVIDFLRMRRREEQHEITDFLRELAEGDPLPVDVYGFTRMGLCEISRARRGTTLARVPT